jgi:hypothetical protein
VTVISKRYGWKYKIKAASVPFNLIDIV